MGNKINNMYNAAHVFVNTRLFCILSRFLQDSRDFISDTEKSDTEKKEVVDFLVEKETIETLDPVRLDQIYKAYFPNENSLQEFKNALEYEIELLDKNMDYYTYEVKDINSK